MSILLSGKDILDTAKEICRAEGNIYLAVSYWNGGIAEHIKEFTCNNVHIVLDVNAGGTSPADLEYLIDKIGERVRVHADLHAKIYASKDSAILGSANASRPGLQTVKTKRVEAAAKFLNQEAREIYDFAKSLYDKSEPASGDHVEVCRRRFFTRALNEAEAGVTEEDLDLVEALRKYPDLFRSLPLLVTGADISDAVRNKNWRSQKGKFPGNDGSEFDPSQFDDFHWRLDKRYDQQLSLALHSSTKTKIYAGLVRPFLVPSATVTFAHRIPWREFHLLKYAGRAAKTISKAEGRDDLREAMEKLLRQDDVYLTVDDLLKFL